jgi:subtilisin family serine protease
MVVARRLLVALLALVVGSSAAPALAAAPAALPAVADERAQEVTALVRRPDGSLAVRRASARGAEAARALAAQWRGEKDVVAADVAGPVRAFAVPDPDPLQASQWGLSAVRAVQAWTAGDAGDQVVAVIDSGVDLAHPDLSAALVPGRDLVDGDGTPSDENGHGTHVAGIVAGIAGNGIGGAGAGLRARVMPVRVLDASGSGSSSKVAEAVVWAVDNGATVLSLSLGGPKNDAVLASAVQYAHSRRVPVVAAMGNDGLTGNPVNYPAALPGVVAVGAVDYYRLRPAFSNTGSHVALVAPGVDVLSTVRGGGYGSMTGTSMATPFVSAAAALLRSTSPALTPTQVRSALLRSATDLGSPGFDTAYGAGLLDVVRAQRAVQPSIGAYTASSAKAGSLDLVARDSAGRAVHRTLTSGLSTATVLGGQVLDAPASATRSGRLEVMARGTDGRVWSTSRRSDGSWRSWSSLGGAVSSRPATAATSSGRIDVVARGADGALWLRTSTAPGSWSAWRSLGGSVLAGTAPAVVRTTSTRMEVLVVGADRQVWRRTLSGGTWGSWRALGGQTASDVSAASPSSGTFTLVVKGGDGAVWTRTVTSVSAGGWSSLGGAPAAAPTVAAPPGGGRLDLVVRSTDGRTLVRTRTSSWGSWRAV